MSKKNIAIYCICFPNHEPRKTQQYQKNMMCDALNISSEYRQEIQEKGYTFDDEGDNISGLNWHFGDLTATYWIWKNSNFDIVGTSHYRRFWDDSVVTLNFDENTLYVQEPRILDNTIKKQYIGSHGELGLKLLDELALKNKIVLTTEMLEKTYSLRYLYSCNMFIAHKPVYDKFCEVLFEIVFEFYHSYTDVIKELDSYNRRKPAFLAERIITALVVNKEYFFPELNIVPLKWSVKKPSVFERIFKRK